MTKKELFKIAKIIKEIRQTARNLKSEEMETTCRFFENDIAKTFIKDYKVNGLLDKFMDITFVSFIAMG